MKKLLCILAFSLLAAASVQASPTPAGGGFDVVPINQKDAIATRLELVKTLIQRYGRAYDYRSMTTSELRAVLASLEKRGAEKQEAE